MVKELPCFIFAIADEDRNTSEVYECETEYDAMTSIRELVHKRYPIESILWVPMKAVFHIKLKLDKEKRFRPEDY